MEEYFARTGMLLGDRAMERLACSRVAVFGLGGVGGHCAEALARCGIGSFLLVDGDCVTPTNINRQAVAFVSTLGKKKVDVMAERMRDINPKVSVRALAAFYGPQSDLGVWEDAPDLVVDAIDAVPAKIDIIVRAKAHGVPVVSCIGAGNKRDPMAFEAADLYETSVCPLCRVMRAQARRHGIDALRVIYSREAPQVPQPCLRDGTGRPIPASVSFVTAAAGLALAAEAVRMLLEIGIKNEQTGNF